MTSQKTSEKWALITGASSGIGLELSRGLARRGYSVILVARDRARLEQVAKAIEKDFAVHTITLAKDLFSPEAPQAIFSDVKVQGKKIEVLVNNAGFGDYGEFLASSPEKLTGMMQVNMVALTLLTRLFLPAMTQRRLGRILNVASTAAFQPGPLMAVYYATKAYVLSFSEAIAEELEGTGVTVTALCPGPTESGFQKTANMEASKLVVGKRIMDSRTVAEEGLRAMEQGKRLRIPGLKNRVMAFSVRMTPRKMITKIVRQVQERAH